jgi:CBS domain-containing protein
MAERWTAGEVCTREVVVALRGTPVPEAAERMRNQHVGCLVVVEENGQQRQVCGVLTDRDLIIGVLAQGLDARPLCAEDIMSESPATVHEDDALIDVMRAMRRNGVRRLPVVTADRALVGLITLDDVLRILADEMGLLIGAIQGQIANERHRRP